MLHCFYYNIFISDKLQDVYRCLLIFNLYNGVAGCLWLLSAKELYNILGEILALLKSLAKLLLISLGPRLNPSESVVYWLFSYCDFFFWVTEMYLFIPMWNPQLLFGFFYRTCKIQHRWEYMPHWMYRLFSLFWSLNTSKKIASKITFVRFNIESSKNRSFFISSSTKLACSVVSEDEELFIQFTWLCWSGMKHKEPCPKVPYLNKHTNKKKQPNFI